MTQAFQELHPNLKFIKNITIENIQYKIFFDTESNSIRFESRNLYLGKTTIMNSIMVMHYKTSKFPNSEYLDLIDEIESLEKSCIRDRKLNNLLDNE